MITYIFSFNNICILTNNNSQNIDKNTIAKLENINNEQVFACSLNDEVSNVCKINLNTNTKTIENANFVEIMSTSSNPKFVQETKNCKITFFCDHVQIVFKTNIFYYYFCCEENNFCIEKDNFLYVFNNKNLLEFNKTNQTFFLRDCQEFATKNNQIEMLCNTPFNNVYFSHYMFNIKENVVKIKQLKKGELEVNALTLPFVFFYLIKANFEDAKKFLNDEIDYENIKKYLKNYNHIVEIDKKYYISGKNFGKIEFKIDNNVIIDVD